MKRVLIALACAGVLTSHILAQQSRPAAQDVEILPVHGGIYMIAGAGGNITASVGKDGVLLVDAGLASMSDKVLDAVRQLQRMARRSRFATLLIRTSIPTTSAGTKGWRKPAGRSPAATSPATSPTPARARRSSPTRTR